MTDIGSTIIGVDSNGYRAIIQEDESCNVVCVFYDGSNAIIKSAIATLTATLFDEDTEAVINSRDDQDILDANGGSVTAEGALTLRLDADDNPIVSTTLETGEYEIHTLRLTWTWNDGVSTRTGIQEIDLYVEKIAEPS